MTEHIGTAVEVLPGNATLSPEWHEARRHGISASDVAAVLGLSPWESPYSLWHRKAGTLGAKDDNPSMRWGRRLEDAIADEFAERHPEFDVATVGLIAHSDRPWQLATPDRLLYDGSTLVSCLEVKTAGDLGEWGGDGSADIPVYYRCQVLWQMDVLGLTEARVALLASGRMYREFIVPYDPADVTLLRDAALAFLDSIAEGAPPDVDAMSATTAALKALHPDLEDTEVIVPDDLADEYEAAREAHKAAEDRRAEVENRLRELLGNARYAKRVDGRKVATRSVYDVAERVQTVRAHTVSKLLAPRAPKTKDIA